MPPSGVVVAEIGKAAWVRHARQGTGYDSWRGPDITSESLYTETTTRDIF